MPPKKTIYLQNCKSLFRHQKNAVALPCLNENKTDKKKRKTKGRNEKLKLKKETYSSIFGKQNTSLL